MCLGFPQKHDAERKMALTSTLQQVANAYQQAHVIKHCSQCASPCCMLDKLVLELNWKQVKTFWGRTEPRTAFDKLLSSGKGPQEIRASNNLYYIHTKPCPEYNPTSGSCQVYNQAIKPIGCTDFPVYTDECSVIVDLRCEAVDLAVLSKAISDAVGPNYRIAKLVDKDFSFLVTLDVVPKSGA